MSDPRITDKAVEAAAKAIYETPHDSLSRDGYSRANRDIQKLYLAEAEAALKAALPHLIDDGAALPVRTDGGGNPTAASSSPQPVDREALIRAAAEAMYHDRWVGDPTEGQFAGERYDDAELQASVAVDAVLALLNGGQANG